MKWTMMTMVTTMVRTLNFSCFSDNWCFDMVNSRHYLVFIVFDILLGHFQFRPTNVHCLDRKMSIMFFNVQYFLWICAFLRFFSLSRDYAFETHSIINFCFWANISLSTVCKFECVCVLVACLQLSIRLQTDHRIIRFNGSYHCSFCWVLFNVRSVSTASRLLYLYMYISFR